MSKISKSSRSSDKGAELPAGVALDAARPLVFVLDDELRIREAIAGLLASAGLRVETFATGAEFLRASSTASPACVVLDLQLPDISGLDLQRELTEKDGPPVIFISGHGDIPTSVQAMKAGATEFLPKPFSDLELLSAIESAIAKGQEMRRKREELAELRKRFARLSAREREVLPLIVAGHTNKQAAADLGIAEITIQVHRAQIMRKLAAPSLPDLVRMAGKLGLS
jgi:FixJ family two-component response regulator